MALRAALVALLVLAPAAAALAAPEAPLPPADLHVGCVLEQGPEGFCVTAPCALPHPLPSDQCYYGFLTSVVPLRRSFEYDTLDCGLSMTWIHIRVHHAPSHEPVYVLVTSTHRDAVNAPLATLTVDGAAYLSLLSASTCYSFTVSVFATSSRAATIVQLDLD